MQLGSISPFFRGHVVNTSAPQEPWQFGTEAEDISRNVMRARYELLPTLYSLFDEARRTGAPILRPLVFEEQDDPATYAIDDQAMLGSGLMVAPILEQGATTRTVYFPEGRWFEVRSGAAYEGPATETIGLTLGALPMFAREGAIIARGPTVEFSEEAPLAPLFLDVYPGDAPSSFTLYEDDGDSLAYAGGAFSRVTYTVEPTASGAVLRAGGREGSYTPPTRTLFVRIRRADHGAEGALLDGSALAEHDDLDSLLVSGEGFFYDDRDLSVIVGFTDTDAFELELVYDRALIELRPPVEMEFRVTVPVGTPQVPAVHIASSANGWMHVPLGWGPGPQEATGSLVVPRGAWLEYKYTRGDWATVEKWPGCVEATNRYELGAAHPVKTDTVFAWADLCD
jgi:alpha-glucosidase